jgi:uncharacterized membrane protein HdeD (DUF308 family)
MVQLVMILLGVDYLRNRWRGLMIAGWLGVLAGLIIFIDALDNAIYFPLHPFAFLLLVEGLATLMVAHTGIGGQRTLRYVKGGAFSLAAILILSGHHHGHFILSMIFGILFLTDGLLQIVTAGVVRYKNWKFVVAGGVIEIMLAIFFFQPLLFRSGVDIRRVEYGYVGDARQKARGQSRGFGQYGRRGSQQCRNGAVGH